MLKIHGDDEAPAKPSGRFKSSVDSCDGWPRDGSLGMLERNALVSWGDIISNKQNIAFFIPEGDPKGTNLSLDSELAQVCHQVSAHLGQVSSGFGLS